MIPENSCPFCKDTVYVIYTVVKKEKVTSVTRTIKSHVWDFKVIGCSDCLMNRSSQLPKQIIDKLIVKATIPLDNLEEEND